MLVLNVYVYKKNWVFFTPCGIFHFLDKVIVMSVLNFKEMIAHFFS